MRQAAIGSEPRGPSRRTKNSLPERQVQRPRSGRASVRPCDRATSATETALVRGCSCHTRALCEPMRGLRQRTDSLNHVPGVGAGGGAVPDAPGYALQNPDKPEGVISEIPIQFGNAVAAGFTTIERD